MKITVAVVITRGKSHSFANFIVDESALEDPETIWQRHLKPAFIAARQYIASARRAENADNN